MKVCLFAIRDNIAASFGLPTVDTNEMTAKRNFAFAISSEEKSVMTYKPSDFDLYQVGYYDTDSGRFESMPDNVPLFICNGSEFVKKE